MALSPELSPFGFGSRPNDGGHLIVEPDAHSEVASDPVARKYLRRYVGARELLQGGDRWCLWLVDLSDEDLAASLVLRTRVEGCRQHRLASKRPATRDWAKWPHLFDFNSQPEEAYLCLPGVASERRPYFTAARFEPDVDGLVDRAFGAAKRCEAESERQQILFARYEELTGSLLVVAAANGKRRR